MATKKPAPKSATTTKKGSTTTSAPATSKTPAKSEVKETALVAPEQTALTSAVQFGDLLVKQGEESWGAGADISANSEIFKNDLMIPKVWQIQAMSEFKKTMPHLKDGDFVSSLTGEVLGNPEEGVNFVVVSTHKKWQAFSFVKKGNTMEKVFEKDYGGIMTLENANWPYTEVVDGKEITRRQVITAIVLLERDIVAGNPQPYAIDFAASSKPGGRKLISNLKSSTSKVQVINGQKYSLPASAFAYKMTGKLENFDNGHQAFTKDITGLGYSSKQAVEMARDVYDFVKNNADQIEFDDRDVVAENESPSEHVDALGADTV